MRRAGGWHRWHEGCRGEGRRWHLHDSLWAIACACLSLYRERATTNCTRAARQQPTLNESWRRHRYRMRWERPCKNGSMNSVELAIESIPCDKRTSARSAAGPPVPKTSVMIGCQTAIRWHRASIVRHASRWRRRVCAAHVTVPHTSFPRAGTGGAALVEGGALPREHVRVEGCLQRCDVRLAAACAEGFKVLVEAQLACQLGGGRAQQRTHAHVARSKAAHHPSIQQWTKSEANIECKASYWGVRTAKAHP